ncbi:hypothetical protein [Dyella nitratireducens]|uniref:hypothetical protein n=1 Tax=Dyella nitratireducens TaxID=1849580 RepID=UPI00166990BC|nr:hypothetical protein [Dyella nitratireducens]
MVIALSSQSGVLVNAPEKAIGHGSGLLNAGLRCKPPHHHTLIHGMFDFYIDRRCTSWVKAGSQERYGAWH